MSWVMVAIGATTAIGQINSGRYARGEAELQAQQEDYQAKLEEDKGRQTAEIIRRAGRQLVGSQVAGYAGAGVKIGEGSALETERDTMHDVEHDAFQAILEGDRRAIGMRLDADLTRIQGRQRAEAGYVAAAGTALQTAYTANRLNGWRTASAINNDGDGLSQGDRRRLGVF